MCYDYSKLLGRMKERGYTQDVLAKSINIKPSTLSQKLNNKSDFKQSEIYKICIILEIHYDEVSLYFFTKKV